MTKSVKVDVWRVTIGNFALGAVTIIIFALLGQFSVPVLWGTLLGCSFVSLSFLHLAVSVSKNVEKDPQNAKERVSATYALRLICAAAMIILAIKAPWFNWVAMVVPLFFHRFVVMFAGRLRTKENAMEEVVEA